LNKKKLDERDPTKILLIMIEVMGIHAKKFYKENFPKRLYLDKEKLFLKKRLI